MIHSTALIKAKSERIIATTEYWTVKVPLRDITEFLEGYQKLLNDAKESNCVSLIIGGNKYFTHEVIEDILLIFITDIEDDDRNVAEKIQEAANGIAEVLEQKPLTFVKDNYERLIHPFIHSKLKVALVGETGVGKTTSLHLILGKSPSVRLSPAITLGMDVIENIHFANYSLVFWDFEGQEQFRKLWKLYFQGADILLLLTDSTLRNIFISKDMLQTIKRDAPHVPIIVIANKQDLPNALDPSIIERMIGAETHPLVAVDFSSRHEILKLLLNTAAKHVNLLIPDLPAEELLRFTDDDSPHE